MNWIWHGEAKGNVYVRFTDKFTYSCKGEVTLTAGSDWEYAAFINGKLASMGQYCDGAGVKTVECVNVTKLTKSGENEFVLIAHHIDADYSVCRVIEPCAAYNIECDGVCLAESGKNTDCSIDSFYGDLKNVITVQCGIGFGYDFTAKASAAAKAVEVKPDFTEAPRPVKTVAVSAPISCEVCAQGVFKDAGGETAAQVMQHSYTSPRRFYELTQENRIERANLNSPVTFKSEDGDGIYVLVDTGRENAGYLCLDIDCESECNAIIGWGEHLADLRPRTEIGGRNFAVPLKLRRGNNKVEDYLHRLGGRYLMLYVYAHKFTLNKLTLREAMYPFADIKKDFGDRLLNKIYEVGKRTLQLCAHVHYEDCVWREQALYAMDSRNQMLFGYGVFGEYELPRASLNLIASSICGDGLPELCPPSRNVITIPSFALYYIMAVGENARADFNEKFVTGSLPSAQKIFDAFKSKLTPRGVGCFTGARYWNFYEWVDGLDGGSIFRESEIPQTYDAILTALFVLAARELSFLYGRVGDCARAGECEKAASAAVASLENFYDSERGMYCSFTDGDGNKSGYHCYTQAAVMLAGVPATRHAKLASILKHPPVGVGECTFATMQFKYDAIMSCAPDLEFCLNEICDVFGNMLYSGATSYYETALGEADFYDAGSLCHAWSAVPCYFFNKYLTQKF